LNAAPASVCAALKFVTSETSLWAIRIPRPPPPAAALMMTGYPIRWAISFASLSSRTAWSDPGTVGIRSFFASSFARTLSPACDDASGVGPMNLMLQLWHTSAKWAFSERNP
jgi:hypothetical protein